MSRSSCACSQRGAGALARRAPPARSASSPCWRRSASTAAAAACWRSRRSATRTLIAVTSAASASLRPPVVVDLAAARRHRLLERLALARRARPGRARTCCASSLAARASAARPVDLVAHHVAPAQALRPLDLQALDVLLGRDDLHGQLVRALAERLHRLLGRADRQRHLIELGAHLGRAARAVVSAAPRSCSISRRRARISSSIGRSLPPVITPDGSTTSPSGRHQRDADAVLPPQVDRRLQIGHQHDLAEQRLRDASGSGRPP